MRFLLAATVATLISAPAAAQGTSRESQTPAADSAAHATPPSQAANVNRRPSPRRDFITEEEVRENLQAGDLFTLIQRLRPLWLRQRAGYDVDRDGSEFPVVRYNDRELGPPEVLREINTNDVITVQYYGSTTARSRFGTGYGRGAIVITGR